MYQTLLTLLLRPRMADHASLNQMVPPFFQECPRCRDQIFYVPLFFVRSRMCFKLCNSTDGTRSHAGPQPQSITVRVCMRLEQCMWCANYSIGHLCCLCRHVSAYLHLGATVVVDRCAFIQHSLPAGRAVLLHHHNERFALCMRPSAWGQLCWWRGRHL